VFKLLVEVDENLSRQAIIKNGRE